MNDSVLQQKYQEIYHIKAEYKSKILQAKISSWRDFCSMQTKENPWNLIYKRCRKPKNFNSLLTTLETENGYTSSVTETANLLIKTFFPDDTKDTVTQKYIREEIETDPDTTDDCPFSCQEVERIIMLQNDKKAPGIDHMSANIIKVVNFTHSTLLLNIFNKCLQLGVFPDCWKLAVVKILKKIHIARIMTILNLLGLSAYYQCWLNVLRSC